MTTSVLASTNGRVIRLVKGVDLPIAGKPDQDQARIDEKPVRGVALVADDYVGMKPTMEVREGDAVRAGQTVIIDNKADGVRYAAPVSGKVLGVNRAEKRRFVSLTIEPDGGDGETFKSYADSDLTTLTREQVRDALVESGLWPAFRARPYGKVPSPLTFPRSIFVTAIDTNPLAAAPEPIIKARGDEFVYGLQAIRHLTNGSVYVCCAEGAALPVPSVDRVVVKEFAGPHPAGLPGTHIHFLDPVSDRKVVWHLGYQDVIAIGGLLTTGRVSSERVVSLAGPEVKQPRLLRVPLGASLDDLTAGELEHPADDRVISGSVLAGRAAKGLQAYLGRYHLQISVVREGKEREFLGWQMPGFDKYSIRRIFAASLSPGRPFSFTTTTGGSPRTMVPIGLYEDVMPLDILPTFLLRSLATGDTEQAQLLGALELDEEDLGLCTFVDPGKTEWGPILRERLKQIEKAG